MFYNGFENPKLAAIRLLRSQGCCNTAPPQKIVVQETHTSQLENLLRYKQELQAKVAQQRAKMNDIPCAVQLANEIQQLQEIIEGLARENKQRVRFMQTITKEATSTYSTELEDDEEDVRENERLQIEYNALMRKLEKTNNKNTQLVNQLINM